MYMYVLNNNQFYFVLQMHGTKKTWLISLFSRLSNHYLLACLYLPNQNFLWNFTEYLNLVFWRVLHSFLLLMKHNCERRRLKKRSQGKSIIRRILHGRDLRLKYLVQGIMAKVSFFRDQVRTLCSIQVISGQKNRPLNGWHIWSTNFKRNYFFWQETT